MWHNYTLVSYRLQAGTLIGARGGCPKRLVVEDLESAHKVPAPIVQLAGFIRNDQGLILRRSKFEVHCCDALPNFYDPSYLRTRFSCFFLSASYA
jgi:hypothetical protein